MPGTGEGKGNFLEHPAIDINLHCLLVDTARIQCV